MNSSAPDDASARGSADRDHKRRRVWFDEQARWTFSAATGIVGLILAFLMQIAYLTATSAANNQASTGNVVASAETPDTNSDTNVPTIGHSVSIPDDVDPFAVGARNPFQTQEVTVPDDLTVDPVDGQPAETPSYWHDTAASSAHSSGFGGGHSESLDDSIEAANEAAVVLDIEMTRVETDSSSSMTATPEEPDEQFVVVSESFVDDAVAMNVTDTFDENKGGGDIGKNGWNEFQEREPSALQEPSESTTAMESFVAVTSTTAVRSARVKVEVFVPNRVSVNENCRLRYRVTNLEAVEIRDVAIVAKLPRDLSYSKGDTLTCRIGSIGPGETREAYLTPVATAQGPARMRTQVTVAGHVVEEALTTIDVVNRPSGQGRSGSHRIRSPRCGVCLSRAKRSSKRAVR